MIEHNRNMVVVQTGPESLYNGQNRHFGPIGRAYASEVQAHPAVLTWGGRRCNGPFGDIGKQIIDRFRADRASISA